jgi:signal transduction histidine kinase
VRIACFQQWEDAETPAIAVAGTFLLVPEELGALADSLLSQRRGLSFTAGPGGLPLGDALLAELGVPGAAHLLLVPLTTRAENIGLLILAGDQERRPFNADDQRLAETISGQIATAITNVRLAEQARRAAMLAERNRVARELHDSATQALYSLSLLAGGWALTAEQGRLTDVPAKFTQLGGIALQVLKELRLLIYELRHPELVEAGLVKALEERLAAVEQRASVRTSLEISGSLTGLLPDHEEQIYAILQEVLNNALRHAQARTVTITVRAEQGQARFAVRDDGVGFDPTNPSAGLGLRSMRERAAAIGAQLTVTSRQGDGALVELIVQLANTGDASNA